MIQSKVEKSNDAEIANINAGAEGCVNPNATVKACANSTASATASVSADKLMRPFAFVFPGQGSQSLGMLSHFAENQIVLESFKEAEEALGYNLWELCQNGPLEKLNQTEYTQPALLTAGVALFRVWKQQNKTLPKVLAGHSLGEYTALVAAEALTLKEAVCLVRERGRLMQQAVPEGQGKMAAILGLNAEEVTKVCEAVSRQMDDTGSEEQLGFKINLNAKEKRMALVSPANFNAPGQIVISGSSDAVEKAMELAKEKGAKRAIALPVSVPSHCDLMKAAAQKFKECLAKVSLKVPNITVLHNADVKSHQDPEAIRAVLSTQLYQPVRWVETIEAIEKMGIQMFYECGPGSVLSGLIKRIVKSEDGLCFL